MTVADMIEKLKLLPQDLVVIVDFHSEYTEIIDPHIINACENGGYITRPYSGRQVAETKEYVLIS